MNFSDALELLKAGKRLTNGNWNGLHMYIEMQVPDEHSKMGLPYLYMKNSRGLLVPWLASQEDLFSMNWIVHEEKQ